MYQSRENTLNLSPINNKRERQFSHVRQQHTQRPKTSNAGTSRKTGPLPSDRSRRQDRSFIANKSYIQHGTSRFEQNTQKSNSPVKKLCVGCFNRELGQVKRQKHKRSLYQQKSQVANMSVIDYTLEQQARHKYIREKEQITQYNLSKIQQNRLKKQQERQNKEKIEAELKSMEYENYKQHEKHRFELINKTMEQLRRDLQEQMQRKKLRQWAEIKQQKSTTVEPIFCQPNRQKLQHEAQQKYRRDLQKQISENRSKKQIQEQEQQRRKRAQELRMMQEAIQADRIRREQRERQAKEMEAQTKHQIQLRKKKAQERRRQEEQVKRQVKKEVSQYNQQMKKRTQIQRHKLDEYLEGLKKQMAINEVKKKQQYAWLHQPTLMQPFLPKQPVHQDCCDGCERKYPDTYLTTITEPLKF